jgi:CHAT domain-containing protein/Tfp pilus assembly protein PilF
MSYEQTVGASVQGIISDATGAVLPRASVTIRNSGTGAAVAFISDERGRYLAPVLPPGEYEIQASLPGFQSVSRRGIRLAVGQNAVVDVKLEIGQVTNQVEVVAHALGQSLDREIFGVERQSYRVSLDTGQFATVSIQQRGVDVVALLSGPDEKLIAEIDADSRPQGREVVEWVAGATGTYKIDVTPKYKSLPGGHYEIRLAELRVASDIDRSLDEARLLHAHARREYLASNYDDAIRTEKKVLEVRERILGPDHLEVAATLFGLGLYQRNAGDIPEAEASYLRALAIREKGLSPDHPDISFALHNLGYLYYYDLRDYARAESLYERALAIKEKAFGANHPLVAATLVNMGLVQWKAKDYTRAEATFRGALRIFEESSGPTDVALCAHNLGIVYKESGDYVNGEKYYRQALQIWETMFGKDHPKVALALESLGILYRDKGDYLTAEPLLQRAVDIEVKKEGANHPDVANTLVILARLYEAQGDTARAVETQWRAAAIEEKNLALNTTIGSERQKLVYFSSMMREADRRVSLHLRSAPDDPKARDLALTMVLQRKGRVLDALAGTMNALRRSLSATDQVSLDRLRKVTEELARRVVDGPNGESIADHEKRIKALEEQREQLEEDLSLRSSRLYQPSQPVTLDAIRARLADNSALIEFAIYHPSNAKVAIEHDTPTEPRYVAYVLRNRGEVGWRELGSTKEIDTLVDAWRNALRDPQRRDAQRRSRAVDERIMKPVRSLLGEATQLLVSPDGELNLLPFAALVDEDGRYLVQRYAFTYLTSGRDLLRMPVTRESKSKPLIIADPAFGEPALSQLAQASLQSKASTPAQRRRSITSAPSLSEVYFAPLYGTALEAREIQAVFPEASLLMGIQATKAALLHSTSPRLLHIATHGFFMSPSASTLGNSNPLLRSGLAFAGANLRKGKDDRGILTALEASGLNLWGTKLVVLSACDTGLGDVRNGEGVYGLRRSFVLAGAESLIMSLWPISDYKTRELMTGYYKNLRQGLGRGAALRQVQLDMLKKNPKLHPFYWADFIQSGDWTALYGDH